jgi:hypothetical protein
MYLTKIKGIFLVAIFVMLSFLVVNKSGIYAVNIEMTDTQAPSLPNIMTNPAYIADSWTNKVTVVSASGSTDNITEPENITYEVSLDGSTYTVGNSVTLNQSGNYTVYFKVTDEAGNSAMANKNIKLDLIAPQVPFISMNSGVNAYASNTWVNQPVGIQIYGAVDTGGSDIAGYQYKIGEGAWTNGDTYTFSTSGDYLLYYRAIDNAGNISATSLRNIKVDLEGPRAFSLQTNISTIDSIYITATTVDDLSGMAPAAYRTNDGRVWSNWRSAVEDWLTGYSRGQQVTIIVEARDNAGNITTSQTTVKTLTNTLPVAVKDTFSIKSNAGKVSLELLKNDYDDDDGDIIKIVAISELSDLLAGKLYLENGKVSFVPSKNFGGNVSFEYTLEDGYGGRSTGIVELEIIAVNEIIEEPVKEERKIFTEPIFSNICIIGLSAGSILVLINYIIHRKFFNKKPLRIILQLTSALIVFPLLCILRIPLGYIFSLSIMVVYIITSYLYATWDKDKNK